MKGAQWKQDLFQEYKEIACKESRAFLSVFV